MTTQRPTMAAMAGISHQCHRDIGERTESDDYQSWIGLDGLDDRIDGVATSQDFAGEADSYDRPIRHCRETMWRF